MDQTIKSGDKKDTGSPLRQMTPEERKIIQSVIDAMYERFLDVILETRGVFFNRDELRSMADGRVYTARQAQDLKLVDMIGYMDDAIALSKEMAGIKEAAIVTYAQPRAYKNNIYSMLEGRWQPSINLINIDAGSLFEKTGMRFMYLWMP